MSITVKACPSLTNVDEFTLNLYDDRRDVFIGAYTDTKTGKREQSNNILITQIDLSHRNRALNHFNLAWLP